LSFVFGQASKLASKTKKKLFRQIRNQIRIEIILKKMNENGDFE
jgi:hypothetical protein